MTGLLHPVVKAMRGTPAGVITSGTAKAHADGELALSEAAQPTFAMFEVPA